VKANLICRYIRTRSLLFCISIQKTSTCFLRYPAHFGDQFSGLRPARMLPQAREYYFSAIERDPFLIKLFQTGNGAQGNTRHFLIGLCTENRFEQNEMRLGAHCFLYTYTHLVSLSQFAARRTHAPPWAEKERSERTRKTKQNNFISTSQKNDDLYHSRSYYADSLVQQQQQQPATTKRVIRSRRERPALSTGKINLQGLNSHHLNFSPQKRPSAFFAFIFFAIWCSKLFFNKDIWNFNNPNILIKDYYGMGIVGWQYAGSISTLDIAIWNDHFYFHWWLIFMVEKS
jgi:hypothetical protein